MSEEIVATGSMLVVPKIDMEGQLRLAQQHLKDLESFAITSQPDADTIAEELAKAKKLAKDLDDQRSAIKEPFLKTGKAIDEQFKPTLEILKQIQNVCSSGLVQWQRVQEEKARQEQARLDAEAAAERQRLREEAEKQSKAAAEAEAAAAQATSPEQARAAQEQAQAAREAQAALQDTAAMTVSAPAFVAKTKAATVTDNWQAEVIEPSAAIKYIAARPELHYLLTIDSRALLNAAKMQKEALQIDGVRVFNKGSVRSNFKKAA